MNIASTISVVIFLGMLHANAIITIGNNDNSTSPPENRGWDTQGTWGFCTGTVVSSNYFLAGNHVGGNVGDVFTIGGVSYVTIAKITDPNNSDITGTTLWKINGSFPANRIAKLYTNNGAIGKTITVIGRGTQRGNPLYRIPESPVITNFTKGYSVEFDTIGGEVGKNFKIQCTTDLVSWTTLPDTFTVPGNRSVHVSVPVTTNRSMFFRTVTDPDMFGWELGNWDGVMRWGTNVIAGSETNETGNYLLYFTFDKDGGTDEACTSPGDSSGGVFTKDNGVWKLIGITYGSNGPYTLDGTRFFNGALFDLSGLYYYGYRFPTDQGIIAPKYYTSPIPVNWIKGMTGVR